nr:MAG TPA: hypothetical protein [Caudoviricetes sp.]
MSTFSIYFENKYTPKVLQKMSLLILCINFFCKRKALTSLQGLFKRRNRL